MSTKVGFIDGGKTSQEGLSRWISKYVNQSGVIGLTDLAIVAAGTPDTTVKISLGDALIGNLAPNASTFFYSVWVTVQDSVTITANASGNPRIDAIVAYIDLASVSNVTADNPGLLKFKDVTGTPAGSPVAPNNTAIQTAVGAGNPFLLLATVAVANGFATITNGNITDQRVYAALSRSFFAPADEVRLDQQVDQNIANNTVVPIAFGASSETYDVGGLHDTVTNNTRITIVTPGKYHLSGGVRFAAGASSGRFEVGFRVNGSNVISPNNTLGSTNSLYLNTSADYIFVAGDYIEFYAFQNGGVTATAQAVPGSTFFAAHLISVK